MDSRPHCPDLMIELVSPSDGGPRTAAALRHRMAATMASGTRLGWFLFPEQQAVEIWQAWASGGASRGHPPFQTGPATGARAP
jgi:Uma2 family endonuclease